VAGSVRALRRAGAFVVIAILGTAASVSASSVHLKNFANPTYTDNGLTLTASGALAGLGNGDVTVNLSAVGNPTATCTNPSGKNQPPGRNHAAVTLTGTQAIPQTQIKNGEAPFSVTTGGPTTPIPGAPGCPNSSWTERITDVAFTSATVTVDQSGTVLTVSCTFSRPTSNGAVPAGNVTCKSS
jgi:hypothetical protein